VLSPSTRTEDLLVKSREYATFGVRQYWVVEPDGDPNVQVFDNRNGTWVSIAHITARHPDATVDVPGHGTVRIDHAAVFPA
jgi:Uma2 family endonuclease